MSWEVEGIKNRLTGHPNRLSEISVCLLDVALEIRPVVGVPMQGDDIDGA